jgi:UDP-N-acetylglucosamine--N-acetylmuramyl-(pentapeptide) pyrophosphoryl-undecaprenol N-acetylglucosamine transferase
MSHPEEVSPPPYHNNKHVLVACGGTGGHLFPGIAVAEVLRARGHDVTLLISEKKIDTLAASGHPHLKFEKMPFLAMPRVWSPKMIPFLWGLMKGWLSCRKLIKQYQTEVVLGMGGFTSLAPLVAGRSMKCRTLIHESNAVPGKANKVNAKFCNTVLTGLKACEPYFHHKDVRTVGTPLRTSMTQPITEDAHAFFNLEPGRKTLLVMGGSQGARGVNRAIIAAARELATLGLQVLHITGPGDHDEVKAGYGAVPELKAEVVSFCHRMELAYSVADLAVARSGASSLTELAYFGVPSLLVPYPFAADDHQTRNAEIFDKAGAARLMPESGLTPETLAKAVRDILLDKSAAARMSAAAQALAVKDSAAMIASLLEKV